MNEVTNFMYYMFNVWCKDEAIRVFGNNLGEHLFEKWCRRGAGCELLWYADLDRECRSKIVSAANEYYNK